MSKGKPEGIIIATYSVPAMLQTAIPQGIANRVKFGFSYADGPKLSIGSDRPYYSVKMSSIGNEISLFGYTRAPAQSNLSAAMNPLIFGLMAVALISHVMLIRHSNRRRET